MNVRWSSYLGLLLSAAATATAAAQLEYVDRSAGLQNPQMEAGNTELEFGDVNGDGHVDLVSIGDHGSPYVNTNEHGVMVWFGDGAGNWSVYQNGNFGYGGVALGDANNDGLLDVGYGMHHDCSPTDFGDQLLEVALGDGTGRNWTPWDDGLATNGETWGMFETDFADVDNDGDLDLGSISFGCCAGVHVYLNNFDGSWIQSFGFVGGNANNAFVFGDINGDGHADFAVGHQYGTVYFGDGTGHFSLADGNLPPPGTLGHAGVDLGDVDADGRDDLVFINRSGGLEVWSWVAPDSWQNLSGNLPDAGGFERAQLADMDLDGLADVVAFASGTPGLIVVYSGDGTGNWQQIAELTTPDSCDHAAFRAGVDADHNGFPDMVYVAEENCQPIVGGINRPRFFAESSTPGATWIWPQYPRGAETWIAGSVRFIDWTAALADPGPTSMKLELSRLGPDGPWYPIVSDAPDNGRYQWRVPAAMPTSSTCYLRYTLTTAAGQVQAVTPAAFTILESPSALPGDIDGDADVDLTDLAILLAAYDTCAGDEDYNAAADLDFDGCVGLADLAILLANYGQGT